MLSIQQLKQAIESSFYLAKNQKINIVVMMDCYMQFLDTALTLLSAQVDYMVGVESGIDFVGYNYSQIFKELFADPDIEPKEMAILIVSSLKDKQFKKGVQKKYNPLGTAAVFANDLGPFFRFTDTLNKLSRILLIEMLQNSNFHKIDNARQSLQNRYNDTYALIDFYRFLEALRKEFGKECQTDIINELISLRDKIILYQYIGRDLLIEFPHSYELGCSVCFPSGQPLSDTNLFYITYSLHGSEGFNSASSKLEDWNTFVKKFLIIKRHNQI
jgi:hypothetical protein